MTNGIVSAVAAMGAAEKHLEAVTTNLANVSVAGYKRVRAVTETFHDVLGRTASESLRTNSATDYSQGPLVRTGNDLDLALTGTGFLAVEGPAGEAYTRNTRLRLDDHGVLQTLDGLPLAWEGGRGTIDVDGESLRIDGTGNVFQGQTTVGRLRVVDFVDRARLERDGRGMYHAPADLAEAPHETVVHQGSIEGSNVSAVEELTALILAQRRFEGAAKLLSAIEQSYRRLTTSR